jgi:hypothetical protein
MLWRKMETIRACPEFASEITCIIPYAYWLHTQGKLDKVETSKNMKPFYYFCDNVEEKYPIRGLDFMQTGMNDVPNKWIHGELDNPGVLDYDKWTPPPYSEYYKTDEFEDLKPYVVISNNYNIEYSRDISQSFRYFDMNTLSELFTYLVNKGYNVIYKRPKNTEFAADENERKTIHNNHTLTGDLEGVGIVTDHEFCQYFDGGVINMSDMETDYSYNELQLRLYSGAEGFIVPNGGGGVLCSYFGKPVVMYVPQGKELRPGYLSNKESYLHKLSDNKIYPVIDGTMEDDLDNKKNNYKKLIKKVKEVF